MPRTYDSGLTAPIRTMVRNAVVTMLAPLKIGQTGGFLEAVIPIGFSVDRADDHSIDLLWQELRGRSPAIAVATVEMRFEPGGAPDRSRGRLSVDLYALSSHRRSVTEGRTDSDAAAIADLTADPGIDVTLELAWQLLFNADLQIGSRANPMTLLRETEIICDDEKTIWQQQWECIVTRDVNKNRDITQLLKNFHTTLKPVGDEPAARHIVEDTTVHT